MKVFFQILFLFLLCNIKLFGATSFSYIYKLYIRSINAAELDSAYFFLEKLDSINKTNPIVKNKVKLNYAYGCYYSENQNFEKSKYYLSLGIQEASKIQYDTLLGDLYSELGRVSYVTGDFERCFVYAKKTIEISKSLKDSSFTSLSYGNLAKLFQSQHQHDSMYYYSQKILEFNQSFRAKVDYYILTSTFYQINNNYTQANNLIKQALRLSQDSGKTKYEVMCLNTLAEQYYNIEQYQNSIYYAKRALEFGNNDLSIAQYFTSWIYLAYNYLALNELDSAEKYLFHVGSDFIKDDPNEIRKANYYQSIGDFYRLKNIEEGSISNYEKAIQIFQDNEFISEVAEIHLSMAQLYYDNQNLEKTKYYLNKSYKTFREEEDWTQLRKNLILLHQIYAQQHLMNKAYETMLKLDTINTNYYNDQASDSLAKVHSVWITQHYEKELQTKKNELLMLEDENMIALLKRDRAILMLVILLLLLVGAWFIFYRKQLKRKEAMVRLSDSLKKTNSEKEDLLKKLTSSMQELKNKEDIIQYLNKESEAIVPSILPMLLKNGLVTTKDRAAFMEAFKQEYANFYRGISNEYPELSGNDWRIIALSKMRLSTIEMSEVLNVSESAVKKARQRLREKMNIDSTTDLQSFFNNQ